MNKEKKEMRRITFQIPEDLYINIVKVSEEEDRSVSSFVRKALTYRIDQHEK